MRYTDKKLIRAAQIAYFQINADILGEVKSKSYTLSEI